MGVTRDTGPRLFPEGAPPLTLSPVACEQHDNGVIHLGYAPSPRMG